MPSQADKIRVTLENAVDGLMEQVATDSFNELVESTPVQSGRLRAGWKMKRGEVNPNKPKLRKGKYRNPRTPKIAPLTPGGNNTIYISNAVPYILETNYGNADKPPTYFVQSAITRVLSRFNNGGGSTF